MKARAVQDQIGGHPYLRRLGARLINSISNRFEPFFQYRPGRTNAADMYRCLRDYCGTWHKFCVWTISKGMIQVGVESKSYTINSTTYTN